MNFLRYTFLLLVIGLSCIAFASPLPLAPSAAADSTSNTRPRNWRGVRVLHIVDSQLDNWGYKGTLKKKFKEAGAAYSAAAWKGSSSRSWLWSGKLQRLIQQKSPHVVLVNLGTNVSRADDPAGYAKFITRLARKIAPRECYWIAPPPLIPDEHGFYDMLQTASKPCVFLDSRQIEFNVSGNRVFHLNKTQSAVWAEQVWKWLNSPLSSPEDTDGV
ncbi:MAG: SGNH/GDSL hydrolase family protein [Deltaproteobacteria bacterium]|nr:SGNH/GDSL hydrolase family protein [Deltaproteobacteria bacterium]